MERNDISAPERQPEIQRARRTDRSRRQFLGAAAGATSVVIGSRLAASSVAQAMAASSEEPDAITSGGQVTRINASVAAGHEFLVTVHEASDGGYVWVPAHVDKALKVKQQTFSEIQQDCTKPPVVGGMSIRIFSITAPAARTAPYAASFLYTRFGREPAGNKVLLTLTVH